MSVPGHPDLLPLHGFLLNRMHKFGPQDVGPGTGALSEAAQGLVTAGLAELDGNTLSLTDLGRALFET